MVKAGILSTRVRSTTGPTVLATGPRLSITSSRIRSEFKLILRHWVSRHLHWTTRHHQRVIGSKARLRAPKFQEHINQAQLFYNSLSTSEQLHLIKAISFELDHVDDSGVIDRWLERLTRVDLALAKSVATNLGLPLPEKALQANPGLIAATLSQVDLNKDVTPSIATRRIAVLIADGFDYAQFEGLQGLLTGLKATVIVIAPHRGTVKSSSGQSAKVDHHLEGQRSTLFDSLFIPGGAQSIGTLMKSGRANHWIKEAFGHLKPIGALSEGQTFWTEH